MRKVDNLIFQNRLRQSRLSFYLLGLIILACTGCGIAGVHQLIAGRLTEGALISLGTFIGGALPLRSAFRLYQYANEKLDREKERLISNK